MCLLCASLVPVVARAQAAPSTPDAVVLDVPDCLEVRGADVVSLVELELAKQLRVVAAPTTVPVLSARVSCAPDGPVVITVTDPSRATPLHIELDLAGAPPRARTRLLALSIAELIATSRLERPQAAPRESPPAPDEPSAPREPTAAESERIPYRLWLAPGLSHAFVPATTAYGLDLGVSRALGVLTLAGELQGRLGGTDVPEAAITLRTLSLGVALGYTLALGSTELGLGAGVRAGQLWLAADASTPDARGTRTGGTYFGPAAVGSALLRISSTTALRLAIEAGYFARGVAGVEDETSRELLALRGAWLSAGLGLAIGLR